MRLDWLKLVKLSLLLNLMIAMLAECQKTSSTISPLPSVNNSNNSRGIGSGGNWSGREPRQRYQLKFLTPYTQYPVRLKDHYGRKGNTRWYKYGSQAYIDEIALSSKFYTTDDEYMGNTKSIHLLLLNYSPKTNFILDHYEPKHQDSTPRSNSNQVYDYDYTFEANIDREIYTLLYLTNFQLVNVEANATIDNIDQVYSDVTCRVTLILPSALSDGHSSILNERLEKSMHLRLRLIEPNTDDSNEPSDSTSKDRRNIRFKPVNGGSSISSSSSSSASVEQNKRVRRSVSSISNAQLYEMEIIEGPIRVFRDQYKSGLNASCSLSLRDYDHTFAFKSFINNTIFVPKFDSPNSASSTQSGFFVRVFSFFMFFVFSINSGLEL